MRPELMNALAVAYLGDAVFEVYVREYLLTEKGIMKPHELQRASVKYVSAYAHAGFMKYASLKTSLLKKKYVYSNADVIAKDIQLRINQLLFITSLLVLNQWLDIFISLSRQKD